MATSTAKKSPFSVVGSNAVFAGVDQGVDFTGPSPVYALGPGVVGTAESSGSGWPGQGGLLTYLLTGGPNKSKSIYVAEDFTPAAGLAAGSVVTQGQVIGYATGSGKAPGIEVGWAGPSGAPLAALLPKGSNYAAAGETQGQDFLNVISGGQSSLPSPPIDFQTLSQNPAAHGSPLGGIPFGGQIQTGSSAFEGASNFFGWITNTKNMIRVGEMIGGGIFIMIGVVMVGRAATYEKPVQQVSGAAKTAAAPIRRRPKTQQRPRPRPKMQSHAGAGTDGDRIRRRPRRGEPGSRRLARGDTVPF